MTELTCSPARIFSTQGSAERPDTDEWNSPFFHPCCIGRLHRTRLTRTRNSSEKYRKNRVSLPDRSPHVPIWSKANVLIQLSIELGVESDQARAESTLSAPIPAAGTMTGVRVGDSPKINVASAASGSAGGSLILIIRTSAGFWLESANPTDVPITLVVAMCVSNRCRTYEGVSAAQLLNVL